MITNSRQSLKVFSQRLKVSAYHYVTQWLKIQRIVVNTGTGGREVPSDAAANSEVSTSGYFLVVLKYVLVYSFNCR